jgi:outer membrane receptor protein involved in Fe transport
MTNRFRAKLLVSTMIVGVAAIATPAMAQTVTSTEAQTTPPPSGAATDAKITAPSAADNSAPTTTNDIVVTGTLIRNPNLVSSSSVTSISEGELTLRAPNTVEEALRGLPGISPGIGTQVNNGQTGISFVDLRGLGPQRSLTLLDGNRIVPSVSSGLTDLNVMPLALLQRVEVLTAGAATTYGADAVSGVVNFITRRDFTGIDVRGDYKLPDRGDGKSYRTDVTVGANFADDRGNAVLSLGYTKIDPLYQTRPFALFGISSTSGKASGASATSVPTAIAFNNGDFLQVDPTSTSLVPQYQGFNFNPYNIFQTPLDQKRAYAAARYDVADGVEVYARGMFSNNTIQSIIAPSGIFGLGENINANNPYLTPTIRNQLCAEDGITAANCGGNTLLALPGVYRRLVELGPRVGTYENNLYDARAGVKVDITKSINLDVSGSYGRSEQTTTSSGYVINSLVQQALLATNTTTCTVTTGNCVPLNLFGAAGSITPAQVAFIQGQSTVRVNTELSQARALLSGDLGTTVPFASNPISFALGAEYRNYTYARIPDAYAQSPSQLGGAGGAVLPFTGSYSVKEGYGELIVPIANSQHFFDELSAQGGVRYSSYSIPGSTGFDTTTYKGGLTWQPVHGLRFRGSYQRAVRAPNIGELFAPKVTGLTNLTVDPCALAAPVGNANLTAVCIAQGANAAQIGAIPNPSAGQANETSGGNVNLKPEVGDTFTAGIVITPSRFVPGLTLTVDYNHILIRNAISTPTPGDAIAACFTNLTAASATSAACTGIVRNPVTGGLSGPSGTVLGLPLSLSNTGRLETDGVDVTANYTHRFGEFRVDLNFLGNYTDKLKFQATPTSFNRDCVGYYSANCGTGVGQIVPKFTFQQRSTITLGSASLSVLWRYINPVNYEGTASDYVARGFTTANHLLFNGVVTNSGGVSSGIAGNTYNFNHIPAYHYFDLSSQFNIAPHYQLTMTVANVFDRDPPIVGGQAGTTTANSGNTFPSTYDVLGRTFTVGVRLKF